MKDWEIIADNLSKADFTCSCVSAIDSKGRTIWIADAHGYGKRFVARADEKLTALILSRISALFHSCYLLVHSAAKHHGIGNLMKRC